MREDLLSSGMASLAQAGETPTWFTGHFGAAAIAGYFLLNDFSLEPPVVRLIGAKLDLMVESFPTLFPPSPAAEAREDEACAIVRELESAIATVANSGHAVIYGSLALRAMRQDPALQTASACRNIAALIAAASQHDPDRYYGWGDIAGVDVPDEAIAKDASIDELTRIAVSECALVYPDEEIAGKRHFFNGEKIHGVTLAQALADLSASGHDALAQKGRAALRKQLYLSRQTPPDVTRTSPTTDLVPTQEEFWRAKPVDGLHVVKLSYAALAAADRLETPRPELLAALASVWNL
jgi:hypothetical protein